MASWTRTVRALVADTLQQFVTARWRGLSRFAVFRHVVKTRCRRSSGRASLQLGYLMWWFHPTETVFAPQAPVLLHHLPFFSGTDIPLLCRHDFLVPLHVFL
jgi:hypothetical protein